MTWIRYNRASRFFVLRIRVMCKRVLLPLLVFFYQVAEAFSFTLSSTVEAITVPSVGGAFQTVNFENSYTNAVPVCTYNLPASSSPPAVVRIQSIGATSMQIRLQQPQNSATVGAGSVFCLVAELGVNLLSYGR